MICFSNTALQQMVKRPYCQGKKNCEKCDNIFDNIVSKTAINTHTNEMEPFWKCIGSSDKVRNKFPPSPQINRWMAKSHYVRLECLHLNNTSLSCAYLTFALAWCVCVGNVISMNGLGRLDCLVLCARNKRDRTPLLFGDLIIEVIE